MSRLAPHRLTMRQVSAHKEGDLADGGGLWLVVRGGSYASGGKSFFSLRQHVTD